MQTWTAMMGRSQLLLLQTTFGLMICPALLARPHAASYDAAGAQFVSPHHLRAKNIDRQKRREGFRFRGMQDRQSQHDSGVFAASGYCLCDRIGSLDLVCPTTPRILLPSCGVMAGYAWFEEEEEVAQARKQASKQAIEVEDPQLTTTTDSSLPYNSRRHGASDSCARGWQKHGSADHARGLDHIGKLIPRRVERFMGSGFKAPGLRTVMVFAAYLSSRTQRNTLDELGIPQILGFMSS